MSGRVAILLVLLFCSHSFAEEKVEIPLSEVWGLGLLETKQMLHLEPERHRNRGEKPLSDEEKGKLFTSTMSYQLLRALDDSPRTAINPGFAVVGEGREALEHVYGIFVKGKTSQDSFPVGSKISAIFFTRTIGFMELLQAERIGAAVTVKYCFKPVGSRSLISPKIAIIPLGTLPVGKYQVNILGFSKKTDDSKGACEPIQDKQLTDLVCQPFEFTVVDKPADEKDH